MSLEFGYVRSIVSKSVDKSEVDDSLSLIIIVDTAMIVASSLFFPLIYRKVVGEGASVLFVISNAFALLAFVYHV
jgi:hypothetical protein